MRYGIILPGGTATQQLAQAEAAERAGWDGVFVWEAAFGVDAWTLLAAIAARTERVRLGTMLTPLPWRRPWKVASQVVTLDQLSQGRAVLAVGLGAVAIDLPDTGEQVGLRERADMMDEGIDLVRALWDGSGHFHGSHYTYSCNRDDLIRVGRPVQERIPIWVVGVWPRPRSMRRVLRCDGIIPQYSEEGSPAAVARPVRVAGTAWGGRDVRRAFRGRDAGRRRRAGGRNRAAVAGCRCDLVDGDALGDAARLGRADARGGGADRGWTTVALTGRGWAG